MKRKIFYKVFAATLACVLLMFVFGIIAVHMNTDNIVSERLKDETELAATLMNEQSDFAVFNKYSDNKEKLIEKQKSDFFANASHELKTPITVMQGFAEMLLNKEGMDNISKKQLERIYKECLRLGSLISDMLMLSQMESRDAPIRVLSEVALAEVAREVLDGLSEKAQSRNISTNIVGSAMLTADQTMIFELVENLVSNAIKYNKDGGSVTVSINETNTGVCLKVEDTGIGIEKEHLPRLCERFYRVDKSHSKRIGGTGLGLAIVKHICAISNAELSIESEFGIGTTVTVVFSKS